MLNSHHHFIDKFHHDAILGCFGRIFFEGIYPEEIPEWTRKAEWKIVRWLLPLLSTTKRSETAKAVSVLYDIAADEEIKPMETSFKFIESALRLWAFFTSDMYRAVCFYVVYGDLFEITALLGSGKSVASNEDEIEDLALTEMWFFISSMASVWKDLSSIIDSPPTVERIFQEDMKTLSKRDPWNFPAKRIFISVDRYEDPDKVSRLILEMLLEEQKNADREHQDGWSDEERKIWSNERIEAENPKNFFLYKDPSSKSRTAQTFLDTSFHALLNAKMFSRHRNETEAELLRRCCGMTAKSDSSIYQTAHQNKNALKKKANRLICNAISGIPMQN